MLAPDAIGIFIFIFLPIIIALVVSLHSWDALSPMRFLGLENYATMIHDGEWWASFGRTAFYAFIYVMMVFWISLFLAVLLNSLKRAEDFFRTAFFIPFSVSTVVASTAWLFIMNDKTGYINSLLRLAGLPGFMFLASTKEALPSIAVVTAWMNVGYYAIIFLAAIKDIPREYNEAALIDGAGPARIFISITFPLLKDISTFVLVISTIASFQVFDQIKIMTNGGPVSATRVAVFYIFRQSFEFMHFGYASALAFMLFLIIFVISIFQMKIMRINREAD